MRNLLRATALAGVVIFAVLTANAGDLAPSYDVLGGVRLGADISTLLQTYSGLYAHRLAMGEVMYEACNQKSLEVYSFTEKPWSRGRITDIWLRQAEDVSVCRDSTGALPDVSNPPTGFKGVRLGDSLERVTQLLHPIQKGQGTIGALYSVAIPKRDNGTVDSISFMVEIKDGRVASLHLFSELHGSKPPYGN